MYLHGPGGQRTTWGSLFSPSTLWVPGIKISKAGAFTHGAMSPSQAPYSYCFLSNQCNWQNLQAWLCWMRPNERKWAPLGAWTSFLLQAHALVALYLILFLCVCLWSGWVWVTSQNHTSLSFNIWVMHLMVTRSLVTGVVKRHHDQRNYCKRTHLIGGLHTV